jgi:HEPN domain-containing protein
MWFEKARMDLRIAKHLRPIESDFYSSIVFHAQQCAEKAIKGFLTHHKVRILKTHDMTKLLAEISKIDSSLAEKFSELKTFTNYAVEYRYPDAELNLPPLSELIVKNAVELAENVLEELATMVQN